MTDRAVLDFTSIKAMDAAFAQFRDQAWPYKFRATLDVKRILGGTPSDPKVGEAYLRSKIAAAEALVQEMVAKLMEERGVTAEEAVVLADQLKHLNGFKRDPELGLYIEGRIVKAALKEASNIAYGSGNLLNGQGKNAWGLTRKGLLNFVAEHIVVPADRIYLGVLEADAILQKFVHTWRGSGIQYEECVDNATISFEVWSDWDFSDKNWATIWLTGEQQGIGASRSQGFGRYVVREWTKLG